MIQFFVALALTFVVILLARMNWRHQRRIRPENKKLILAALKKEPQTLWQLWLATRGWVGPIGFLTLITKLEREKYIVCHIEPLPGVLHDPLNVERAPVSVVYRLAMRGYYVA